MTVGWLIKKLKQLRLADEGVAVLGIEKTRSRLHRRTPMEKPVFILGIL